jgi:hypothetical protein
MSETPGSAPVYPYSTHLDVKFGPLEHIDVPALEARCRRRMSKLIPQASGHR